MPVLRLALASLVLFAAAPTGAEELSPQRFKNLVERTRGAVLKVVSHPGGTAVLVGVHGELLVEDRLAAKDGLTVEYKGERLAATMIARDSGLGVALLRLPPGDYPAATVGSASTLSSGSALVGLGFDEKGELHAEVGHFAGARATTPARLRTDVAGPPGTALFNARGELVAIHAGRPRATFPIDELRARLGAKRPE